MERIDYHAANVNWNTITTTTKDGELREQQRVQLRYWVDGKRKTKSKLFPASKPLDTDRKKANAVKEWIKELDKQQDEAIEAERRAEEERKLAEEAAAEEERDRLEREREEAERGKTVMELVDWYIESGGRTNIVASTIADYRATARRLRPHFSTVYANELRAIDVQKWEQDYLKSSGVSAATVGKCHRLLKSAYRRGQEMELVNPNRTNPMTLFSPPTAERHRPNALDQRGAQQLTAFLLDSTPSPTVVGAMLALHAGLRQGECCGLRWCDIDLDNRVLIVQHAVGLCKSSEETGGRATFIKQPKNGRPREVPFDKELADVLTNRRDLMKREAARAELLESSFDFGELYVLGRVDGSYCHPTVLGKEWRALAESQGLSGTEGKRVVFHDLRKSYATAGLAVTKDSGKSIAGNMGHSDTKLTLDTYGAALTPQQVQAANAIGDFMRPPRRKSGAEVLDLSPTGTDE